MSSTAQCSHGSRPPPPRRRYLKSISSPSGQLASSWYTARSMARMECHGRMLVTLSADQAGRRGGQGIAQMLSCRLDNDTRSGPAQSWSRVSAPGHESHGSRSAGRCAPRTRAGPGWRRTDRTGHSSVTLRPDRALARDRPWSTGVRASDERLPHEPEHDPARLTSMLHLDHPVGGHDVAHGAISSLSQAGHRRSWVSGSAASAGGMSTTAAAGPVLRTCSPCRREWLRRRACIRRRPRRRPARRPRRPRRRCRSPSRARRPCGGRVREPV
jgi:hypothetical protein